MTNEIHFIVKILNERGKKNFSEIELGYDSTDEKVEVEYARTIKPDGKIAMVGEKDIRDVSRYLNFPLYSNARVRIISMPELSEGAIVEYKAKVIQNRLINKKDFNLSYALQESEPVVHSRFKISLPQDRRLNIKILNPEYNPKNLDLSPKVSESKDAVIYSWEFRDIPQIEIEPSMPPAAEITPVILVSTFDSWDEIYKWWWDLAKDRIPPDEAITQKAQELTKDSAGKEEKLKAIYNYCVQDIRYVGIEYGQAGYQPHKAAEIFKNKYGDCKDKAVLFISMLKAIDIEAYPVLIGTRGVPALSIDFPAVIFNHCIAAVEWDGKIIFLDITAETCSFGDLPEDDQDRRVLLFKKDNYQILQTPLLESEENRVELETRINLAPDESILGARRVRTKGQFDQAQRYWLRYTPPNLIEYGLKEKIQALAVSGELIRYNYENRDNLNLPIELNYEFKGKNFISRAGSYRILPKLFAMDTTMVAKDKRVYPLELGQPNLREMAFKISLPENLSLKYLPEEIKVTSPWLDWTLTYSLEGGNEFSLSQKQILKKRQVSQSEYPEFKKFLEDLTVKTDEYIILERKNGPEKRK